MGLFSSLFAEHPKSYYDKQIASLQRQLEYAKADLANIKLRPKDSARDATISGLNCQIGGLKAQIADLKAKRRTAPKG